MSFPHLPPCRGGGALAEGSSESATQRRTSNSSWRDSKPAHCRTCGRGTRLCSRRSSTLWRDLRRAGCWASEQGPCSRSQPLLATAGSITQGHGQNVRVVGPAQSARSRYGPVARAPLPGVTVIERSSRLLHATVGSFRTMVRMLG